MNFKKDNMETLKELKTFLTKQETYTSQIAPVFYPMSGSDLSVLENNYFSSFIFCDFIYLNYDNNPSIENRLGLLGFSISKIETLSDSALEYLNIEYKKMDKTAGFAEWGFADQGATNELPPIKKYHFQKNNRSGFLILIQGESACVARLLKNIGLELNLLIKTPGGNFNGNGASDFVEIYKRISNYEPKYVLGSHEEYNGFSELKGYIKFETNNQFNIFAKTKELIDQFNKTNRAEAILNRFK